MRSSECRRTGIQGLLYELSVQAGMRGTATPAAEMQLSRGGGTEEYPRLLKPRLSGQDAQAITLTPVICTGPGPFTGGMGSCAGPGTAGSGVGLG
jgi:hypothetical protein